MQLRLKHLRMEISSCVAGLPCRWFIVVLAIVAVCGPCSEAETSGGGGSLGGGVFQDGQGITVACLLREWGLRVRGTRDALKWLMDSRTYCGR